METNAAVRTYVGKLPPFDPETDDSFLDWMSRFLFGFVDLNVGKMTKSLVRKQSCVETYFKVRCCQCCNCLCLLLHVFSSLGCMWSPSFPIPSPSRIHTSAHLSSS